MKEFAKVNLAERIWRVVGSNDRWKEYGVRRMSEVKMSVDDLGRDE